MWRDRVKKHKLAHQEQRVVISFGDDSTQPI